MNSTRKAAEQKYNAALAIVRIAEMGTDELAWQVAEANLTICRRELVGLEMQYPTYDETKKQNNRLRLGNRGLDV